MLDDEVLHSRQNHACEGLEEWKKTQSIKPYNLFEFWLRKISFTYPFFEVSLLSYWFAADGSDRVRL